MQFNNVYFITPEYLKKYYSGYIDQNIDDDAINSFILMAQSIRVQSVLGYDLFNKYINDIITYNIPQGQQYVYLMDNYIQPSLALWTLYEALPSLNFKLTNKALSTKSSDYGKPATKDEVEYIRQQISNNAQFYDSRIREYITNYPNLFPEYYQITGVNRIKAKNNTYFGGLWLPDVIRGPKRSGQGGWQQDDRCCTGMGYYL